MSYGFDPRTSQRPSAHFSLLHTEDRSPRARARIGAVDQFAPSVSRCRSRARHRLDCVALAHAQNDRGAVMEGASEGCLTLFQKFGGVLRRERLRLFQKFFHLLLVQFGRRCCAGGDGHSNFDKESIHSSG